MNTCFPAFILRVALKRKGAWFIDTEGNTTRFVHNACLPMARRNKSTFSGATQVKQEPIPSVEELAARAGFKFKNKHEAIEHGCCIKCGQTAKPRIQTSAGASEYLITGLCEICFDDIFTE